MYLYTTITPNVITKGKRVEQSVFTSGLCPFKTPCFNQFEIQISERKKAD